MEGRIRVTTEKVRERGESLVGTVGQARLKLQAVKEEVEGIEGSFQSEAVAKLKRAFGKTATEGLVLLSELVAHLEKLQEIAVIYEEAEAANELVTADN